jgi:hypothetical protein
MSSSHPQWWHNMQREQEQRRKEREESSFLWQFFTNEYGNFTTKNMKYIPSLIFGTAVDYAKENPVNAAVSVVKAVGNSGEFIADSMSGSNNKN